MDCETCSASTVCPVTMPVFDNILAIINVVYYKYKKIYCLSMFTKIVVSVVLEVGSVFPNLPTATNS